MKLSHRSTFWRKVGRRQKASKHVWCVFGSSHVAARFFMCSLPFICTTPSRCQASIVGALAIADLVKTSLGPKGMDKILQSAGRGNAVSVTNDGATILKSVLIDVRQRAFG